MDLQLVSKGLDLCKRKKKWVVLLALFGVSSYGAYRVYHLPSVTRKRRRLLRLLTAFFSVVELVSDSADTVGVVSRDLKEFLKSDSDEIPNSLKQIAKIVRSDGFSDSLSRMSEALTVGILRGSRAETNEGGTGGNASFADKMMDKMLSSSGTGFVSAVAGSFARNLVMGFYANGGSAGSSGADVASVREWVSVVCDDKCKDLMANCIQVFVSTAVAVYLDKTMDINTYDELFAGLTNPNHESKMREVLVSVCNGAVETLVKTSHQVLTSKNTNSDPHSSSSLSDHGENSKSTMCEFVNGENVGIHLTETGEKVQGRGWGNMVFSTLSVPSNRRFVLDVTGRVTSETVRSVAEFLHWKLSDGFRRRSDAVHDHVRDKGLQVVRYFGLKSYVAMAICLALLLHIVCGSRAFLPA